MAFRIAIREDAELRLLEEHHASGIYRLVEANRARLRRWLPWVETTRSAEDVREFIRRSLEQFARNEGYAAAIWFQDKPAGVIGFHPVDWSNKKVELGYWIGAGFEGKGLVTDACRVLIHYAFDELKLNRVEIRCATGNAKSCAIPARLGFQFEGMLRQAQLLWHGYLDLNVFGLLISEWADPKHPSRVQTPLL